MPVRRLAASVFALSLLSACAAEDDGPAGPVLTTTAGQDVTTGGGSTGGDVPDTSTTDDGSSGGSTGGDEPGTTGDGSAGGTTGEPPGDGPGTGGKGGQTGTYTFNETNAVIHAPATVHDLGHPVSIIVGFHGAGDSKENFMNVILGGGSWGQIAEDDGIIIVSFQGTAGSQSVWEYPIGVNGWPLEVGMGDVNRVIDTLNYLATNYDVDTSRIYAIGLSMGATMSAAVALNMDEVFAAFMATAQGLPASYSDMAPDSGYKVPALFQGDPADPVYASGPYTADTLESNGHTVEEREFPGTGHVGSWMTSTIYDPGPQQVWDWLSQFQHP